MPCDDNGVMTIDTLSPRFQMPAAEPTPVKPRQIAIVAKATSSCMDAPYGDPAWEIWSQSDSWRFIQDEHWHRWFELHDLDEGKKRWLPDFWIWLATDHGRPIYLRAPHPHVPHGIVYPRAEIVKRFGTYFNNSISLMLAIAINEIVPQGKFHVFGEGHRIALFGVDMACHGEGGTSEYAHQRPSCEFFLGIACGAGINIELPPQTDLLTCDRIYGLDSPNAMQNKYLARIKDLKNNVRAMEQQIDQLQVKRLTTAGALDNMHWVMQGVRDGFCDDGKDKPAEQPAQAAG